MKYSIAEYKNGKLYQTFAGLGRNKGTWDCHFNTRATAVRHLKKLKAEFPKRDIRIEEN